MKRCGFILLGLSLIGMSGDSSFDFPFASAGEGPQQQEQQQGALAENAAAVLRPTPGEVVKVHRTVHADVVAIDQPFVINRLGASQPAGMIFVLKNDLVAKAIDKPLDYKNFKLRSGKRPRPLVLRMNVGDLLEIHFENWLQTLPQILPAGATPTQQVANARPFQQKTRYAGIHVNGLDLVPEKVGDAQGILSDGSWVGQNDSGLLPPRSSKQGELRQSITYRLYARQTGTFLLTSGADTTVHQLDAGLFGAVNVQPQGAEWYRSQTTHAELQAATLNEDDLRSHEQTLGVSVPTPKLTPDQDMLESDQEATAAKQARKRDQGSAAEKQPREPQLRSLRTTARGPRTAVVANVFVDEEGQISSKLKQPLINYFSVFNEGDLAKCPTAIEGKPILSMLKAEIPNPNPPKLTHNLERGDGYAREIHDLDSGFITFSLRQLFTAEPLKADLAPDATVARIASENKYSWVVTNPGTLSGDGKTYLVQGNEADRTVTIQECQLRLVYSDLTAIITGPNAGNFPFDQDAPDFYTNPASPDRRQPYREFTIIYHQGGNVVQAFQPWSNNNLFNMINAGMDAFGINYGFAAIGPEIVANRLGVGPMGNDQQPKGASGPNKAPKANQCNDAVELKYEEFFLSSWAVGDPAMVVDVPSNAPNQMVSNPEQSSEIVGPLQDNPVQFVDFKKLTGARPTKVFYPDDPSNVYHSYMRDHTKMRVLHAGPGPAHVHHLHAHQWLKSPNSPEATYLDSQLILPGSAYTLEITYHGSGNRNQTVGDSIFHCHFYPHFAKGMWSLWRVHDTFEEGTRLDSNGVCVTGKPNRALPDGEIIAGTPIPAVIPLPTLGMAPMPAPVKIADLSAWYGGTDPKKNGMGRRVEVIPKNWDRILKQFDNDHDGELSDDERKDWYEAIAAAEKANEAGKKQYGDVGYQWVPYALYDNPGYPFFVPGVSGHRPPHPPMDTARKEGSGFDLRLMPWRDGTGVPTSGNDLVVVGIDDDNRLHIRIFDEEGERITDTDETKLPPAQAQAISTLKRRIPGLLPSHVLTDEERSQVLREATSIVGLRDDKAKWTDQRIRDELHLDPDKAAVKGDKRDKYQYLNGGLPRHLVLGGDIVTQYATRWDFSKDFVKPMKIAGFDLKLMPWGNGSGVPTSGKNLVIVGVDDSGLLHIRTFDDGGNRVTDADETKLPATKAGAISTLKQQLPRLLPPHVLTGAEKAQVISDVSSIVDPTIGGLYAFRLPEQGTPVERAAMKAHATRTQATTLPENGDAGNFILNGLPPTPGAPYADPSVTDDGNSSGVDQRYQAAVIQTDVVLNKKGWHYPQSRFITLWEDVAPTIRNDRAPEPFFIRVATNDATVLWHTNLVPNYYELDDFQVRTPTDVIGQHIHLVKFDVTASDGSANGYNYEDGTFGPTEVRDRIHAISNVGGLFGFDPHTGFVNKDEQKLVAVWPNKYAYPKRGKVGDDEHGLFGKPPANQCWEGAMTTIQRWAIDPLLNWQGHDRTLRTVFTHDHFGPSTHQQVGLYAGVLVEPQNSQWYLPDGQPMNTREDGGPTSWQAMIVTSDPKATHREYAIEFQDMHLAYTADGKIGPSGSNQRFRPKLSTEAQKIMKKYVPGYDGDETEAPAAFFVGQTSPMESRTKVPDLIKALKATHDGDPVPDGFKADLFPSYGIPLDKVAQNARVYTLAPGDVIKGYLGAQWLFVVNANDANGPVLNGGDYYILEATNPITTPFPGGSATAPWAISVFTPSIPPGFTDPDHAVNPNPGDMITGSDPANTYRLGNLGTPHGDAQPLPPTSGSPNANISNLKFGNGAPYPLLVSTRANGTYSMNYRNEPVQLRVKSGNPQQTDLASAFSSIDRDDPRLNVQPKWNEPISAGSPYKFPPPLFPPPMPPPNRPGGYDLRLMPWGNGSGVPTSGKSLALIGTDTAGLLHIRTFDAAGNLVMDTDEARLTGTAGGAIGALKQQLPGLLPPRVLTDDQKAQVLQELTSILGQTLSGSPQGTDPFTPLIRGYVGDDIQIRTLVGAHLQPHAFSIHGVDWLSQPSYHDSGYRNVQSMGISEHYEMRFKMPPAADSRGVKNLPTGADYFYSASTGAVGLSNGLLGIMRSYTDKVDYLKPLINNPYNSDDPKVHFVAPIDFQNHYLDAKAKNPVATREFRVVATTAAKALKDGKLVYNKRADTKGEFSDPNAVIFVRELDLDADGKLKSGVPVEPLILRAAAGDWIKLTLINQFPEGFAEKPFDSTFSFRYGNPFNDLPRLPGDPGVHDVQLMPWGDGSGVATSGKSLVLVGADTAGLLHIRSFDAAGVRTDTFEAMEGGALHLVSANASGAVQSDTPESSLPPARAQAITDLKQRFPAWLLPHVLSDADKGRILSDATSITDQTLQAAEPRPTIGTVDMKISHQVGLHPQLVAFDVTKANGINVGFNPQSTVGPGKSIDYYWYAGEMVQRDGKLITTPVEFGATNLVAADLMLQTQFGLVGALVIEPEGSTWTDDSSSHAFSTVTTADGHSFRECVLVMQNLVKNVSPGREDDASQILARDPGFGAVNYRTENFAARGAPGAPQPDVGFGNVFSNSLPYPANNSPPIKDPETPIFEVTAGTPTRFRVVMPSTTSANSAAQPVVFAIHGHGWQDEPYVERSTKIGNNDTAQFIGAQEVTVTQKYDIVIDSAGGPFRVPGDYLYQAFNQEQKMGIWGLFRVRKPTP